MAKPRVISTIMVADTLDVRGACERFKRAKVKRPPKATLMKKI